MPEKIFGWGRGGGGEAAGSQLQGKGRDARASPNPNICELMLPLKMETGLVLKVVAGVRWGAVLFPNTFHKALQSTFCPLQTLEAAS